MDAFREPTPEEAKMVALQFMGQNMGALKELDKNIINRTNTLQGNRLDVKNILNSIPGSHNQQVNNVQAPAQHLRQLPPQNNYSNNISVPNNDALVNVLDKVTVLLETVIKLLEKR